MATSLSIYVKSIYALWVLCSDLVYVILFPQLTCAVYFESTNAYGSFIAFIVAILLRLAGGEITLGLDPLIRYPWHYINSKGNMVQLFPYKPLTMLVSLACLFCFSWLTNYLFKNDILPTKFDILRSQKRSENRSRMYSGSKPVLSTHL